MKKPFIDDPVKGYRPDYSKVGYLIFEDLKGFDQLCEKIKIRQYVIMPDHLHILLEIVEELETELGRYLALFKKNLFEKALARNLVPAEAKTLFEYGFNDQFLERKRSLDKLYRYIKKNPYWWWMRSEKPEFFNKVNDFDVEGVKCSLYGNVALLDNPFIYPVIVHRKDFSNPEVMRKNRETWKYGILNGGVLAGGFANKPEKEILEYAIKNDGKIILLQKKAFGKRQKPGEKWLELCCKGNLLIISPDLDLYLSENREYEEECHFMNKLAEKMAGMGGAG